MKVVLYMATSADGLVAKKDGDSDWVSDVDAAVFDKKIKELGCIVVGRTTFDQYYGDLYPVDGVTNIVLTTDDARKSEKESVVFVTSARDALEIAKKKGHQEILLIGGGTVNGMFLKEGLVDEMILSVHPKVLGEGIRLFEGGEVDVDLELKSVKQLGEDLVQLRYKVKKASRLS